MIASLRGIVLAVTGTTAVIEVGGVGYSVTVTSQHALSLRVGAETFVRTAMIVRDDDLSLFGFATTEELEVFDHLRGVTGVGPKSAIGVLSAMAPAAIAHAVTTEDDAAFRKVSGIGPKTAKLIVVSLAGKLAVLPAPAPTVAVVSTVSDDVVLALVGLGWPERVAAHAVEEALATASDAERVAVPALLRLALAALGPQQFASTQ